MITTFSFTHFHFWDIEILRIHLQKGFSFWGLRPQAPYRAFAHGPHWGTS